MWQNERAHWCARPRIGTLPGVVNSCECCCWRPGYPQQNTWAIKADGSGQIVWRKNWKCYVPSMLVAGELLYVPQYNGVLHCIDAATGQEHWSTRLGGDLTSSPVVADGKLYATTESGKTFVFRSSKNLQQIFAGDLGERCYATPSIAGGRIYIRTYSKLFCFGDDGSAPPASSDGGKSTRGGQSPFHFRRLNHLKVKSPQPAKVSVSGRPG